MSNEFVFPCVKTNKCFYLNVATSFDIETSSFYAGGKKQACMYVWQFAINTDVIIGRTWHEFLLLLRALKEKYDVCLSKRFVIYVHNLAYEFQFIRKLLEWNEVFATDERKPLKAVTKSGFEFRCSYRLSGYSLAVVAKNLTKHSIAKLVGDLDYTLVRTSITPLTNEEIGYCVNDVIIVTDYINECIDEYGTIANIPMTQTGKVRRYVRNRCFLNSKYKYNIRKLELMPVEYMQLRKAFQGGFTHANAMYAFQTCNDITSFDFTSSYPAVMCSEKFPMSKGRFIKNIPNDALDFYLTNYCCMFDVMYTNIIAKYPFETPISFSKCFRHGDNTVLNNGRVFSSDMICVTITEIDFKIYKKFYNYETMTIKNMYIYKKDYLPKEIIESILNLYKQKTELKNVVGKETEYMHSKEMLNSCYGMCVTDLLNDDYIYTENNEWATKNASLIKALDKYNNDRNRFLFYAWGVWVTAYARRNLFSGIFECKNDYVYSDTDSIKIFNAERHLNYIEKYNESIKLKLKNMCASMGIDYSMTYPCTVDGKTKPLGAWDFDGKYDKFKTLGAKRYLAYNKERGFNLTVAGVNKKTAMPYLLKKCNNDVDKVFFEFTDTLFFPAEYSGKKTLTYIDNEQKGEVMDYLGNVGKYDELSSIHMENSEYNMNIACQYLDFVLRLNKKMV